MTLNASDILAAALSAGGAVSGLLAFLTGWRRETVTTERYRLYLEALNRRDQALASATPEGRDAILREPPISQPPPLGAIAIAALVAAGTGLSIGGGVAAVPQVAAPGPSICKSCDPPCPRGQYCSGGVCVSNAETPEGSAALLKGGFMTLPGWADLTSRTPWDRAPERY